ncbi:MAG TPA: polyprenyl synthetase family protein [Pseudonocardiaceae bacterium]
MSSIDRYALLPPGKLVRSVMTLLCAEAVGGHRKQALTAALGLEYLHAATLVHDDIIDEDLVRRGRPTVPVAFGRADAIVAGDHLIFSAFDALAESRAAGVREEHVLSAVLATARAGADLCRGQVMESTLVGDLRSGVDAYLEMVRLKTGALFRAVCHVGAVLGGADRVTAEALAGYGEDLGVAFQIGDDVLAHTADVATTGKSPDTDLTNGRPTLPVLLAHRQSDPEGRAELAAALGSPAAADVARVRELVRRTGAVRLSRETADRYSRLARGRLTPLEPSAAADTLAALAGWTVGRRW